MPGLGSTKKTIADTLYKKHSRVMSMKDAKQLVDDVFVILGDLILAERPVRILDFGRFRTKYIGVRYGRNPRTGEKVTITPRTQIYFKASRNLAKELNKNRFKRQEQS